MNTAIQEMVIHADQEISPLGGKFTETAQALVSHTLELRTVHELERLLERTDDK